VILIFNMNLNVKNVCLVGVFLLLKELFLFLMLVFMLFLLIFHVLALNLDNLVKNPWLIVKMDFGMKCLTMSFPSTMNILIVFLSVPLGIINMNTTSSHVFSNL
jgi:hypothetical protein